MPEVLPTLELGCGMRPTPNALHHDRISHSAHVDVAHDLDVLPWPWPDELFQTILAFDVLEHLHLEVAEWLNEAWRILQNGGELELRLPAFDNPVSYRDPTHRRVFHDETFYYWQPGHPLHQDYGRVYYAEAQRWWQVVSVSRANPDVRYGIGDLFVVLRKLSDQGPTTRPLVTLTDRSERVPTSYAVGDVFEFNQSTVHGVNSAPIVSIVASE